MSILNEHLNMQNTTFESTTTTKSKLFKSATDFSFYIEKKATEEGIPCYQVLLDYCDENDIDPEDIAKYVSQSLYDKMEVEFAEMGLLKKKVSLEDYD